MKYDEFPDRNQYIHGLCFEGSEEIKYNDFAGRNGGNTRKILDLKFCEFRNREDSVSIDVGKAIVGLQVNTTSHADHISRLGFLLWGEGESKRTKDDEKSSKAWKAGGIDFLFNIWFFLFSIAPLLVAAYFVLYQFNPLIEDKTWFDSCDTARSDSVVDWLKVNRIYFYVLGGVTILRLPQWLLYQFHFFRRLALIAWFLHFFLFWAHLTIILLVNKQIDAETCEGWKHLRTL